MGAFVKPRVKRLIIAGAVVAGLLTTCGGEDATARERRACAVLEDELVRSNGGAPKAERLQEAATLGIDVKDEEIRVAARLLDTALEGDDQEGIEQGTKMMQEACEKLKQ
jgi:hypothetical protein